MPTACCITKEKKTVIIMKTIVMKNIQNEVNRKSKIVFTTPQVWKNGRYTSAVQWKNSRYISAKQMLIINTLINPLYNRCRKLIQS